MTHAFQVADVRHLQMVLASAEEQWRNRKHEMSFLDKVSPKTHSLFPFVHAATRSLIWLTVFFPIKASKITP